MNGAEHYQEAERLLRGSRAVMPAEPAVALEARVYHSDTWATDVAAAQVHATLALVAKLTPTLSAATPDRSLFKPFGLMERISTFVSEHDGCTSREIREGILAKPSLVVVAVRMLVDEGYVSQTLGPRRTFLHHTVRRFVVRDDG